MSKITTVLGIVALAALVGCASTNSSGSAGAVKAKDCCAEGKTGCTEAKKADGSMGAVGEKKAGCCSGAKTDGSMGAVAPKADCSAAKTCPASKTN